MSPKESYTKKSWAEPQLFIISRNEVTGGTHHGYNEATLHQGAISATPTGKFRVFFTTGGHNGHSIINSFGTSAKSWFS